MTKTKNVFVHRQVFLLWKDVEKHGWGFIIFLVSPCSQGKETLVSLMGFSQTSKHTGHSVSNAADVFCTWTPKDTTHHFINKWSTADLLNLTVGWKVLEQVHNQPQKLVFLLHPLKDHRYYREISVYYSNLYPLSSLPSSQHPIDLYSIGQWQIQL